MKMVGLIMDTDGGLSKIDLDLDLDLDSDYDYDFDLDLDLDYRWDSDSDFRRLGSDISLLSDRGLASPSTMLVKGIFLYIWGRETSLRFLEDKIFLNSSLLSILSSSRLLYSISKGLDSRCNGIILSKYI
jgi:hypothetical protein